MEAKDYSSASSPERDALVCFSGLCMDQNCQAKADSTWRDTKKREIHPGYILPIPSMCDRTRQRAASTSKHPGSHTYTHTHTHTHTHPSLPFSSPTRWS
jgi:hypothetical protein